MNRMDDPNYVNALWQAGIIKDRSRQNHLRRIEMNRMRAMQYQHFLANQQKEIAQLRQQVSANQINSTGDNAQKQQTVEGQSAVANEQQQMQQQMLQHQQQYQQTISQSN